MRNIVVRRSVAIISQLLALIAVLFVSTASLWRFHRPSIPAELRKKK